MAKRIKKAKSSRSNLRLETLEQRQLLATIVAGSGTEVGSNIVHSNGNTYDQILLTGASVTVAADPGEIVRVSFLDQGGDIVQAEFSGKGTMTVSLEDLKTAGSQGYINKNPAQPGINYVQGLATITVDKPEWQTNVAIYAAGNLQNPGFFSKTDGDNGLADIARLILVGDPTNAGGYSNMGGIYAGGVVFSASTGAVGIRGENVAVQNIVSIGDIDAKGSGVPTLMFNSNSQFQNVFVRGGDLRQTNKVSFDSFGAGSGGAPGGSPGTGNNATIGGFSFFESTDGTTSQGKHLWATPVNQDAVRLAWVEQQTLMSGDWVYDWTNVQDVKVSRNGVDLSAVYGGDWLAKGGIQNSLDHAFERRTFLGNITIVGDVPASYELNLADARGNVTIDGNLYGYLTVNGYGASIDGTLLITGDLDGAIIVDGLDRAQPALSGSGGVVATDGQQNVLNALVVHGSTGAFTDVRAEDIGSVTIRHNFSGIISTDVTRGNAWTDRGQGAGTGYRDVEGKIGNVSIGYNEAGASTGGSIINGTIQGMSGIGNVKVGGDIYGTAVNQAVFVTTSNAGAAPTDVRNYGTANIGTIDVRGDVDLDRALDNLILIKGNGTYGNITVQGLTTTNTVPGAQIGTKTELIPGSSTFVRILSPFTDAGFTPNPATGQVLVQNFDPDGVAGPADDTYFVTASDVTAGAQVYDIASGKMVAAKVGDRVPALSGGVPIIDTFGNVLYRQNTALYEGKTQEVPIFGPDVVTIVSGNRGNLNDVYNHFGKIEITGLLGAQQKSTGTISISDSVDMTFGGVTVNSSGSQNQGVIGTIGTIGAITINNTSGATADLKIVGTIGSPNGTVAGTNGDTAQIGLAGLNVTGFEDVLFANVGGANLGIHVTGVNNGVNITTVTGSGNGTGAGTVSPSVIFESIIQLDNGTSEAAQTALLNINTGGVNSTIGFKASSGIVGDDGSNTGNGSAIGAINLNSDYVYFDGQLSARTIGAITLTGGSGINSSNGTAVKFGGNISATTIDSITASASSGNVVFAPSSITGIGVPSSGLTPTATITNGITLTTAGTNNGGDITLGNGSLYNVNTGNITVTAGHKLFANKAGAVVDNPGDVTINLGTSGNIGNLTVTTTTGNINNALVVRGDAGDITYTAGAAVVTDADDVIGGPGVVGDLARFGSITANQTIWGTRGVTTFETYGQNADGTAKTLPEFTVGGVTYKVLPTGSINATLNYAGASRASGDAFIAKTGGGNASINYNIISNDDNNDGVISISEIGHGGNVNVSSVSGDISFTARTSLPDVTHVSTLGNVSLKTGTYAQASGLLAGANIGDINFSFDASGAGGFEGKVGNITATTTGGNITGSGDFDGVVGAVTLTTGAVAHTGGVAVGNINLNGGLNFNQGAGLVKATVIDIGTINGTITSSGTTAGGIELNSQYGAINATVGAGSFDANGNGQVTANEFGRTGDVTVKTQGGVVNLTLNSNAYTSDLEQSMIGNVTIDTVPFINVKAGATDVIGTGVSALGSSITGASGAINIVGAGSQVGAVGNITATTTVAAINQTGTFGDVGTVTYKTTDYFDVDTNPNVTGEAPVLIGSGSIGVNGTVNGKHGQSKYSVTEDGTISGSISYGGAATSAESLTATSARGNITLSVYLHDADRDNSGNITANEYGTFGSSTLSTTSGGDINLSLGTDQNNAAVLARGLVPQFTFGDVTASVVDRLITASASTTDTYDVGNITINGVGADATSPATAFGSVTGNRGTVGNITAGTQRGNLTLAGNFGSIGDQNLTVTGATDAVTGGTSVVVGGLNYSPSIWGTAGTATLRSVETGVTGSGTVVGGGITGMVNYGGSMAAGKTVAIDAKTGTKDIDLTVNAKGYDLNGDGLITDGVDQNIPGEFEFAKVGNIVLETTKAGSIFLDVGTTSANGSKVGSSIGNISAIADDDIITEKANAADTIVAGNVTITGVSSLGTALVGGTVGDVNIVVKTGNATLAGDFNNIGATSITTSSHTDTSGVGGVSGVQASGNIKLGTTGTASGASAASLPDIGGNTTLNIAGTYKTSTLTVADLGTISGLVFVAGQGTNDWSLTSDKGAIDVGFIAGFDANGSGGALSASEAGALGSITAKSNVNANVTVGVGGRAAASTIGNVSVQTGDVVTVKAEAVDTFASGNATIRGLGTNGTVGNLTANVKTGVATLSGGFGGVGNVVFRTEAALDADSAVGAGEETIVVKAGDINLNAVEIWGAHGTLDLVTVDSSALAAGKSALAGTVADTGTITGSVTFSGGLAAGVTSGIVAKTDRGTFNVAVTAGKDENTNGTYQAATEAGTVGDVSVQSTDGAVTLSVLNYNAGSSFGNIALSSGTTWREVAEAPDVAQSTGTVTLLAPETTGNKAYGTVGNISLTTATGAATIGAAGAGNAATFNNVGTITVTTSAKTDADTAPGLGEIPAVIAAGDIAAYVAAYGTHNTISLTTVDNALAGAPALGATAASITGAFTSFGSLASGSTSSVVLSTQQGNINFDVTAATRTKVVDGAQGTNTTADDANTNSDDIVGSLGNVSMTSSYGNITTNLNSAWVAANPATSSDVGRAAKIGNVTLSTGSSFEVQLGAGNDIAQLEGAITIGGSSNGEIGNITATTQTGNIASNLGLNNKAGNIAFTSAAYVDGGTEISAGDISLSGTYANLTSTTIGNINLKAQGTGTVAAAYTADVAWVDTNANNKIDSGEQRTFTSGSLTAEAVNGNITFGVDVYNASPLGAEKEGFGSTLGAVSLTTTGTGSVAINNSVLRVAEIVDFSAVSGGGITVDAGTSWDASKITKIALTANKGDITTALGSRIALDFADATNSKTTSLELVDLSVRALDGNISWNGDITAFNGGIGANAKVAYAAGASDNRTFKFTNLAFSALNGSTDNGNVDGNITVTGQIGGAEVTSINAVTFTTATPTDDKVTLSGGSNIVAHDIGTLTFNSNTELLGSLLGGANIIADDSQTTRELIGTKNYSVASTGTTPGKGSNLDSISSIVFNGAVRGEAGSTLLTGTSAEIKASQIGSITVNAKVDPSFTFLNTIENLDVKVGPNTGEFIAENAAAASATGYNLVTAFTVGDISITHDLYAPAAGTAVFSGNNVFSILGGMGKLTIDSKQNGNFQAPLFAAGGNGNAIFALADYDDNVGAAGSVYSNVVNAAGGAVALPDGKISVGAVYVNAGSSAAVPPQVGDIGNAGGGTGHGFVLAVAAVGDGTANVAFTPGNAGAIDVTRGLYGYVSSVEFRNNGVRPDLAGNNIVADGSNTVNAGGTVVVAGDGTVAADIGDIVNEASAPAIQPITEGFEYLVGDDDGNGVSNEDDVIVYVL